MTTNEIVLEILLQPCSRRSESPIQSLFVIVLCTNLASKLRHGQSHSAEIANTWHLQDKLEI
jgi:hypothetical protein